LYFELQLIFIGMLSKMNSQVKILAAYNIFMHSKNKLPFGGMLYLLDVKLKGRKCVFW